MKKLLFLIPVVLVVAGIFFSTKGNKSSSQSAKPTPTPEIAAEQLPVEKQPSITLKFDAVGHYVTVSLSNLNADALEYNLIYDAVVKKNKINTGVSGGGKITGKSDYTQQQLLGSESSGKFTYHENIENAVMEVTLRDASNRSVFSATYPFTVTPGKSVTLKSAS